MNLLLHPFDVAEVSGASGGAFVSQERGSSDEVDFDLAKGTMHAIGPRFAERDSGEVSKDVDRPGGTPIW